MGAREGVKTYTSGVAVRACALCGEPHLVRHNKS